MLLGRTRQLEAIRRLLDDARTGSGRGLLVSGEPGIGKTALLAVTRERADGLTVIDAAGVEAEATLPFAALAEVAAPLLHHLPALPRRQASAVEAALALGESSGPFHDPLAVCAGFLALLRAAADHTPLLLLIDDAHWLDSPSAECLGYAARRLDGARVGLLAAARPVADNPPLDGHLTDEIQVTGLDQGDALRLLERGAGDVAPTTAQALIDAAAGNPLALLELPSLLTKDQRRGLAPFVPVPQRGGGLWLAFERQVAAQGDDVATAMVVAAASIDRELQSVCAACGDLGIDPGALERAEAAGLLDLGDDRIGFSHPLLRAVVYHGAPRAERRRANTALAAHAAPDAAAWHLSAAALGPDPAAADALEAAADRAAARGAYRSAADALERCATLTSDEETRGVRQFAAGLSAAMGGAYARGEALLEPVADTADPLMRASARHLLSMVRLSGGLGTALGNHAMLVEEAGRVRDLDPALAATLYADAGVCATVAGDCRLAIDAARHAAGVLPEGASPATRCQVYSMLGGALAVTGSNREARETLDEAGALLHHVDPLSPAAQSISFALHGRLATGQADTLFSEARTLAQAASEGGSSGLLPYYELLTADSAFRLGEWDVAEREAEAAVAIAEHSGQLGPLSIALVIRGRVAAGRGDEDTARHAIERGMAIARPPGYGSTAIWGHAALGFSELSQGRPDAAIAQLDEAGRLADAAGLEDPAIVPWRPDLAEALVRAGHEERAQHVCAELTRRAERVDGVLQRALAARCRGLTAREDDYDRHFDDALAGFDQVAAPLDRARTLLNYGSRLHRACRRIDARERLREALAEFERLGAAPWAERTRAELRASGAINRPTAPDDGELTAQEARVALGVARGATNREIAGELFLSPKTVEFHLGRVYRKLGIRSRTELAVLVSEGRAGVPALEDAGV